MQHRDREAVAAAVAESAIACCATHSVGIKSRCANESPLSSSLRAAQKLRQRVKFVAVKDAVISLSS